MVVANTAQARGATHLRGYTQQIDVELQFISLPQNTQPWSRGKVDYGRRGNGDL